MTAPKQGPQPTKLNGLLDSTIAEVVDIHLRSVIAGRKGTVSSAAKELNITRAWVYRRLKKYGFPEVPAIDCWAKARAYENQQLRLLAMAKFTNDTLLKQMEMFK